MSNRIAETLKGLATGAGFLLSCLLVLMAVGYGVFGWLALIYGAGLAAGFATDQLNRRQRVLPLTPFVRRGAPWIAGAVFAIATAVLLHPFIHPQFSWSNLLFLFQSD